MLKGFFSVCVNCQHYRELINQIRDLGLQPHSGIKPFPQPKCSSSSCCLNMSISAVADPRRDAHPHQTMLNISCLSSSILSSPQHLTNLLLYPVYRKAKPVIQPKANLAGCNPCVDRMRRENQQQTTATYQLIRVPQQHQHAASYQQTRSLRSRERCCYGSAWEHCKIISGQQRGCTHEPAKTIPRM